MSELHNHTGNAEKFEGALDKDAMIYQKREEKTGWVLFKSLHGKEKWGYFVDYYLRFVLIIAAVAALLIWFIVTQVTAKKAVLNILVINNYGEEDEANEESWFNEFLEQNDYNPKKTSVSVSSSIYPDSDSSGYSMAAAQVIVARYATKDVDLCFSDEGYFLSMTENGYFADLEDYLTEEELSALGEDSLIYALPYEDESEEETEDSAQIAAAASEEEIPVGIRLDPSNSWLRQMKWYDEGQEVVVGISSVIQNEDLALTLLGDILS